MKEHEAILQRVARAQFRPAGLTQKGRSRTWFDDHGWWLTMVELQPSNWDRGTYLNVGVMWLVFPLDHAAFHDGYGRRQFVAFADAAQFEPAVRDLCAEALKLVEENRASLRTFADAHARQKCLLSAASGGGRPVDVWNLYFTGAFARLAGQRQHAEHLAEELAGHQPTRDWEAMVQRVGLPVLRSEEPAALVDEHVRHTRSALALPPRGLLE